MIKVTKFKALQDLYIIFKDDLDDDMLVASADDLAKYAEEGEEWTWEEGDGSYFSETGSNLSAYHFVNKANWKPIEWKE